MLLMKRKISFQQFTDIDIAVGTVLEVKEFKRAHVPAYRLKVDFGEDLGIKQTSARVTKRYSMSELKGRKVVAVVNFPEKNIAGFMSECLLLGAVGEDGDVALLNVDEPVQNGQRIG